MRLLLPLGTMFLAALLLSAVALQVFSPTELAEENEPVSRSARAVAEALNSALRMSNNPEQTLDAFVQTLGTSEVIRFRHIGTDTSTKKRNEADTSLRTPGGLSICWRFRRSTLRFPS